MAGENCISDNLIALYMPKSRHKSQFSPHVSFPALSFSFFLLLFSHLPSLHCLSSPRLTCPSSPFTRLSSPSGGFAC